MSSSRFATGDHSKVATSRHFPRGRGASGVTPLVCSGRLTPPRWAAAGCARRRPVRCRVFAVPRRLAVRWCRTAAGRRHARPAAQIGGSVQRNHIGRAAGLVGQFPGRHANVDRRAARLTSGHDVETPCSAGCLTHRLGFAGEAVRLEGGQAGSCTVNGQLHADALGQRDDAVPARQLRELAVCDVCDAEAPSVFRTPTSLRRRRIEISTVL